MLVADEIIARARLESMVAALAPPPLTEADIVALLASAKRPDAEGVVPSDDAWVATWDLDAAAADGWELKAGMCVGGFDFESNGKRFDRSQVHAQCLRMVRQYRRGRGSARTSSGAVEDFAAAVVDGLVPLSTDGVVLP